VIGLGLGNRAQSGDAERRLAIGRLASGRQDLH
jgi:hypothetical protein